MVTAKERKNIELGWGGLRLRKERVVRGEREGKRKRRGREGGRREQEKRPEATRTPLGAPPLDLFLRLYEKRPPCPTSRFLLRI